MIRALCLMGGLTGALSLSQYPEFSQQYLQRLGGHVSELTRDLKQLDAMALDLRMGREDRLEEMAQVPTFAADAAYWRAKIARHARLSENLTVLRAASPLKRLTLPHRMIDGPTVQEVWGDFTPAVPVSVAGATAAGAGFLGGWLMIAGFFAALTAPFRRKRARKPKTVSRREPAVRLDPPVTRPTLVADPRSHIKRLAGAER